MRDRVVFDCMLFVQAVTSDRGSAFKCFTLAEQGKFELLISPSILAEIEDVLSRPWLIAKYPVLTRERVAAFVAKFTSAAVLTPDPPKVFSLPRDPDDQTYTDLAVAANASYLVTWNDRHLTYLMRKDTPEGIDFCNRFPGLTILTPPDFLSRMS
jgi:putative PIN family toxin of toxin-antitoxin system